MKYEDAVKRAEKIKIQLEKCKDCIWAMKQEGYIVCPFVGCIQAGGII